MHPTAVQYLDFVSQFTTDIRRISGWENVVADAPSRVELIRTSISPNDLAEGQATDTELTVLLQGTTAIQFETIQIPGSDMILHCDTNTPVRP